MSDFPFALSENANTLCRQIVDALRVFGDKTEEEAVRLVTEFFRRHENIEDDPLLYHEPAYYYAMSILHHPVLGTNNPMWYQNAKLWPPPQGWESDDIS